MPYSAFSQQSNARLPEGLADVRGFEVRTVADDARVGKVADLLTDSDGQQHYLDVDVGGLFSSKHVLLPLAGLQVDAARQAVLVSGMRKDDVKHLPEYGGDPRAIAASRPAAAPAAPAAPAATADVLAPAATAAGEVHVTLSAEELALGTRTVSAGEVGLHKTVETERVRRTVPVAREEVTIERRPAGAMDAATAQIEVTDDEIRIPIFAEEVVVEKRVVAKEQYIVRTRRVTETQTVEADLRRERLDVEQTRVDQASVGQSGVGQPGVDQAASRPR